MRDTELYRPKPTKGLLQMRGLEKELKIIMFDAVQNCRTTECPIYDKCPYTKDPMVRCSVETTYLKAIRESLWEDVGIKMTQDLLNKIGLHLIPLYHQLIRLQIYAYSITDVHYFTPRGQLRINPVFKEIRDTIRTIESTQKSMGMENEYLNAMNDVRDDLRGLKKANPDHGDPDYMNRWRERSSVFPEGERDPDLRRAVR